MRLDKYLSDCGAGTRSEIKKLIKKGLVQVEGLSSVKAETQIDPENAVVTLNGVSVKYQKFIYLMLNKPPGYVSATWDARQSVVLDLVPQEYLHYQPFPVGRLDIDTEGFCLLTNDGQLAHRLLSPVKHIPKTYYAEISGRVTQEDIKAFSEGVTLDDGYLTKPATLSILEEGDISRVEVIITEGKFHQIKRMFLSVGKEVVYLKRTAMNHLELDPCLGLGEIREITKEELLLLEKR